MIDPRFTGVILAFIIILCILIVLACAAIGIRVWVKIKVTKRFGWDDHALIASFVINIATFGLFLWIYREQAKFERGSQELFDALSLPYIFTLLGYISASILVKCTIAAFFARLVQRRWHRFAIMGPLGFYCLSLPGLLCVVLFRCGTPVRPADIIGKDDCAVRGWILGPLALIAASLNAICDWTFAFIPLHMLLISEKMDRRARWSARILIGLAMLGSVISLVRIATTAVHGASFGPSAFDTVPEVLCLSVMENLVVSITISLAVLKPMIVRWFGPAPPSTGHDTIGAQGQPQTIREQITNTLRLASPAFWGRNQVRPIRGVGMLPDTTTVGRTMITIDEREDDDEERDDEDHAPRFVMYVSNRPMPSIGKVLQQDEEATAMGKY